MAVGGVPGHDDRGRSGRGADVGHDRTHRNGGDSGVDCAGNAKAPRQRRGGHSARSRRPTSSANPQLPAMGPRIPVRRMDVQRPQRIGSGYRARVTALSSTKEVLSEVVAWDPRRSFGYALRTPVFPIDRLEVILPLETEGSGTRLNHDSQRCRRRVEVSRRSLRQHGPEGSPGEPCKDEERP